MICGPFNSSNTSSWKYIAYEAIDFLYRSLVESIDIRNKKAHKRFVEPSPRSPNKNTLLTRRQRSSTCLKARLDQAWGSTKAITWAHKDSSQSELVLCPTLETMFWDSIHITTPCLDRLACLLNKLWHIVSLRADSDA